MGVCMSRLPSEYYDPGSLGQARRAGAEAAPLGQPGRLGRPPHRRRTPALCARDHRRPGRLVAGHDQRQVRRRARHGAQDPAREAAHHPAAAGEREPLPRSGGNLARPDLDHRLPGTLHLPEQRRAGHLRAAAEGPARPLLLRLRGTAVAFLQSSLSVHPAPARRGQELHHPPARRRRQRSLGRHQRARLRTTRAVSSAASAAPRATSPSNTKPRCRSSISPPTIR